MPMLTAASFPHFFEAIWHHPPFDWQVRLLARVHDGGWPSTLDLPTGSGKTAALDVALFALALDAGVPPAERRQARRIVLVVDRRVVVDQAHARAVALADALLRARDGALADVAAALRSLQSDPQSLPVLPAILRGGMPRETEWARTPDQPVLLVSTVDQVGSRLLFRGYGVSDGMRPVHAGLLGHDTLYLLDEVHLSRPFEETLDAVAGYARRAGGTVLPRPPAVVRMSATVAEQASDTFALDDGDRAHPILSQRLTASKRARLREVKTPRDAVKARDAIARACIQEVERLAATQARAIAVIVNRVDTARRAAALAARLGHEWTVKLMTGRMRPLDRDELQAALLDRIRAGRVRNDDRILVVATQAVEAGADLDFDALVTECASLDALRQRFGRLDRLGELGTTEAVIVAGSGDVDDRAAPDPVYGGALRATWRWLGGAAHADESLDVRVVDFGIGAFEELLGDMSSHAMSNLVAPRPAAPILLQSHLDRWVQTSPIPSADPDVAAFLHGPDRGAPEVHLVWRADVTAGHLSADDGVARAMLAAVPPSSLEALSVPLWTARSWLAAVAARDAGAAEPPVPAVADVEGAAESPASEEDVIAPAVIWRGDGTVVARQARMITPGSTLVVPSTYGGLDAQHACWDPGSIVPVPDRGDEAHLRQRGRAVLRWHDAVVAAWAGEGARGPVLPVDDVEEDSAAEAERDAFEAWRTEHVGRSETPAWAHVALRALASHRIVRVGSDDAPSAKLAWRASYGPRKISRADLAGLSGGPALAIDAGGAEASTEDDGGSFTGIAGGVSLTRHLDGVAAYAQRFAGALSLPPRLVADIALAGRLHDLGKADPRFQRMLHGGDPVAHAMAPEPLAKSPLPMADRHARRRAQERAGYPRGTRHELASVALAQHSSLAERAGDWDLVLHLVAAHHGHCRPFAPPVLDHNPVDISVDIDGAALRARSDHGLVRVDSGIPERFWALVERYGWWGLAWLEAIIRLADHRESEAEQHD